MGARVICDIGPVKGILLERSQIDFFTYENTSFPLCMRNKFWVTISYISTMSVPSLLDIKTEEGTHFALSFGSITPRMKIKWVLI